LAKVSQDPRAKDWGDWTIADLQELIRLSREGEEKPMAQRWLAKTLGGEFIKALPLIGDVISGAEILVDYYKERTRTPEDPDTVKDFPILGKLNMDPHLIHTIEDNILNQVDEEYQQYLGRLPSETLIKNIIGINDFIRQRIATATDKHVVITDKSGAQK
jgi:hypothetical protein